MAAQFLLLLVFQVAALLLGWAWLGPWGAAAGALLGGLAWLALEQQAARRLLRWLRQPGASDTPILRGPWGEAAQRVRKLLRLAEQQRAASDARLQDFLAAIQASPNGVVLLDEAGRIEWCNQTAAQHLGFDAQRDAMQQIGNLVREPAFTAYLAGHDYSSDLVIPGREHSESRPRRMALQLHGYGEGRRLMLSRDVTSLEQAEAMRRDFVANVSHEIRTPLTVLSGFVETLQNLSLEEAERRRYLALMAQQATRMQALVDDLLTLSRLEGSPPPAPGQWFDVAPLLARCEADTRTLAAMAAQSRQAGDSAGRADRSGAASRRDAPHELAFDFRQALEGMVQLDGSFNEIFSACFNLLSNAIRYTPPGGSVRACWRTGSQGEEVFEVSDSGQGIAPEHVPRLTERFYRVDQSRSRQTGGTGLGLAIVKHVLQRHGARLRIASEPGKGSTFAIEFPAARCRHGA
jgi:two-component system phosphate regulon sensor histidine kinase PhoR